MNRKTTRLIVLASLVVTAGLAACKSTDGRVHNANATGGVGSGPYTEWTPITPPSKQAK